MHPPNSLIQAHREAVITQEEAKMKKNMELLAFSSKMIQLLTKAVKEQHLEDSV